MESLITDDIRGCLIEAANSIHKARDESGVFAAVDALEDQILKLIERARASAADSLARWLAHKLNSPLGAISGSAQLLLRRLETGLIESDSLRKCVRYAEDIISQTERCALITRDLANAVGRGGELKTRRAFTEESARQLSPDDTVDSIVSAEEAMLQLESIARSGPGIRLEDSELGRRFVNDSETDAKPDTGAYSGQGSAENGHSGTAAICPGPM
ncbi:MAG: hypothetical protein ACPL7K_07455 [Armatimonadota bacterium]